MVVRDDQKVELRPSREDTSGNAPNMVSEQAITQLGAMGVVSEDKDGWFWLGEKACYASGYSTWAIVEAALE